jgi:RNA exonuclease 1
MYLLHPNQMLDNDYRLPSYIEPSSTPIIPGVDIASLPEALRDLLTRQRDVPEFTEEEAMNGNGGYPSKLTKGDDGWIETPEATGPPLDGVYPVLSIDCEMVGPECCRGCCVGPKADPADCHSERPRTGPYIHH